MSVSWFPYKGTERLEPDEDDYLNYFNLCNANAYALLGLLNLSNDDMWGECPLPELRRAVVAARASFDAKADQHTREGYEEKNFISVGLDKAGLLERLDRFEQCLVRWQEAGATRVCWG